MFSSFLVLFVMFSEFHVLFVMLFSGIHVLLVKFSRFLVKTLLEDLYIYVATAAVILSWKGVGMAVDMLANQFPVVIHGADMDLTGVAANLGSFLLLSACYSSGSLVGKGAERDGSLPERSGV